MIPAMPSQKMRSNRLMLLLTLAAVLVVPAATRADNIDQELYKQAPRLMEYLKKQGYQNVGVLKFRVQRGTREADASFNAGPLNRNMASRMENALILANDVKQPVGIIRDASQVAAGQKLQDSYTSPTGRRSLFTPSYPLAWGNKEVKADAFVTGLVSISKDNRQARVVIEAFDHKGEELKKIQDFSVRTDRIILADAGKSFLVAMRGAARSDPEDQAADSASTQGQDDKTRVDRVADRPVDLDIRYNGKRVNPLTGPNGELRIPAPPIGDMVVFRITNLSKVRLGVLLGVNGINTLFEEPLAECPPAKCTKWILEPGETQEINGFYLGENKKKLFKVTEDLRSLGVYGDQLGMIHLSAFEEGDSGPSVKISGPSLRGLSQRQLQTNPPKSFAELQYRVAQHLLAQNPAEKMTEQLYAIQRKAKAELNTSPLVKKGGVIIPKDEPVSSAGLNRVEFKNPQLVMEANIRYFDPKTSGDK
jgi:hypothetical protein